MDRAYEGNETRQLVLDLGFVPVVPPKKDRTGLVGIRRGTVQAAQRGRAVLPAVQGLAQDLFPISRNLMSSSSGSSFLCS